MAESHGLTADVGRNAEAAANAAAAARIEAQAMAGGPLREMAERDERKVSVAPTLAVGPAVTKSGSSRWQQAASVPPDVHAECVHEAKAAGDKVSSRRLREDRRGSPSRVHGPLGAAPPSFPVSNQPTSDSTS